MTYRSQDLDRSDPGATMADPERPISNMVLRRQATEVIPHDPAGTQPWPPNAVPTSHPSAGGTQLLEVPRLILQPVAIVDVARPQPARPEPEVPAVARDVDPPAARPRGMPQDGVATGASNPKISGKAVIVLSPEAAEPSRPTAVQRFEPMPAPLPRALTVAKPIALTTALDTPAVRIAPARSTVPPVEHRRTSSKPSPLARLGTITRRYPVGVFGGAAVGALVLGIFFVGLAQILGLRHAPAPVSKAETPTTVVPVTVPPSQPAKVAAVQQVAADLPGNQAAEPSAAPVQPTPTATAAEPRMAAPGTAAAIDPNVSAAVGALFGGRLIEAEQAYRELASRHPDDPAYRALARILGRHNGADCRPGNPSQKACPTVNP